MYLVIQPGREMQRSTRCGEQQKSRSRLTFPRRRPVGRDLGKMVFPTGGDGAAGAAAYL